MPRIAGVEAELCRAESDKYAAPLLLLHGLWAAPRIWRPTAGYLAHRGWTSYLLGWRGSAHSLAELSTLAQRAADELGAAVIGHDLGALVALGLERARAAVALAPLACGAGATRHPFATSVGARLARWRGGRITPRDREARRVLGSAADTLVAESARWLDDLERLDLVAAGDMPRLVMTGGADPCLSRGEATALARRVAAEVAVYDAAGHDLPYGAGWQAIAGDLHRWLVRRLGGSILLLRGDEDLRDEEESS